MDTKICLISRLRFLSQKFGMPIGNEAADEVEQLRSNNAVLQRELTKEREYLAEIIEARSRQATTIVNLEHQLSTLKAENKELQKVGVAVSICPICDIAGCRHMRGVPTKDSLSGGDA